MKIFKTKASLASYIWLLLIIVIFAIGVVDAKLFKMSYTTLLIILLYVFIWYINFIYPKFQINKDTLNVTKFLDKEDIDIKSITRMELGIQMHRIMFFVPFKYGITIHYHKNIQFDKYHDIRIWPENEEEFIKYLLGINPNITIHKLNFWGKEINNECLVLKNRYRFSVIKNT